MDPEHERPRRPARRPGLLARWLRRLRAFLRGGLVALSAIGPFSPPPPLPPPPPIEESADDGDEP